jgi:hypothetical protein
MRCWDRIPEAFVIRQKPYDFLLVFVKKAVNFFSTLSPLHEGQVIFGFASNSLIVRKTVKSFLQSLQVYSYAGIAPSLFIKRLAMFSCYIPIFTIKIGGNQE